MSLETELFKLIDKCEYSAAGMLLANNKRIDINALDEEGNSLFMAAIRSDFQAPPERYTFIENVLLHPDFQHANKPVNGFQASPFKMAVGQMDPRLVDLILKYKDAKGIQVIFEKDKLGYELQAQKVQRTKERRTNNSSSSSPDYLDEQQQILISMLHATVLHAIKTDDPSILQRLADAGAKLHHPLKDGTYAMDLVRNQSELNVHQWLSKYIKEQISSSPAYFFAASNLARKQGEQEQAIVKQHTNATRTAIKELFKFHDLPEEQPADKSGQQAEKKGPGQ